MSQEEKVIMEQLKSAVGLLPEEKREFIRGYAEGVVAASQRKEGGENHE